MIQPQQGNGWARPGFVALFQRVREAGVAFLRLGRAVVVVISILFSRPSGHLDRRGEEVAAELGHCRGGLAGGRPVSLV